MPERIRLSRAAGWRKPEGAIVVARPSKWGNPFTYMDYGRAFPSLDDLQLSTMIVRRFGELVRMEKPLTLSVLQADRTRESVTYTYPSLAEIRDELAGRDLACWCEAGLPCHADVLLEVAN